MNAVFQSAAVASRHRWKGRPQHVHRRMLRQSLPWNAGRVASLELSSALIPFSGKLVLLSNATCYDAGSVAGFLSTKLPDGRCCLLVLTGSQIDKKAGVPDHSNFEAARWTRQGLNLDRLRQDGCRRGWNRPRWRYVYVWRMCTVALLIN